MAKHFLLTYHISLDGEQCSIIQKSVSDIIDEYENICVFEGSYIIQISKVTDWEDIRIKLNRITSENGCDCKFIMTSILEGGYYNGWLQKETWPKINDLINSKN